MMRRCGRCGIHVKGRSLHTTTLLVMPLGATYEFLCSSCGVRFVTSDSGPIAYGLAKTALFLALAFVSTMAYLDPETTDRTGSVIGIIIGLLVGGAGLVLNGLEIRDARRNPLVDEPQAARPPGPPIDG
jgi:hypothetical protein